MDWFLYVMDFRHEKVNDQCSNHREANIHTANVSPFNGFPALRQTFLINSKLVLSCAWV